MQIPSKSKAKYCILREFYILFATQYPIYPYNPLQKIVLSLIFQQVYTKEHRSYTVIHLYV